jgi:hypothetical protein
MRSVRRPIEPSTSSAHVICSYCGATNVVATERALHAAKLLEHHGIRLPDRPKSLSEVSDEIAQRDAAAEGKRRTAIVISAAILVLVGLGILALALTGNLV